MNQNFWENIQNVDRRWLYLILIVVVTAGLFINVEVPAEADESSKAFYVAVQDLNPERPVLLQSDWTNSTRGENAGHMEAILRILIHRKQKFVVYSLADPQAPQVARNVIRTLNKTLPDDQKLVEGRDYLDLGFFPNAEGTTQAMATNLRKIWGGRTTRTPDGGNVPIFETDVLRNVNR
ncbi:MAG: hypothetical protein MH204_05535, partial [Fimbriimonadaceae bacterium]|nr:hypothetical protein [Fimbriimonadaceae bacterium]